MDSANKIPGAEIQIGLEKYIVPPLSFRALKNLKPVLAKLESAGSTREGNIPTDEEFDMMCEVVLVALKRNYPNINIDVVLDNLDLVSAPKVLQAAVLGRVLEMEGGASIEAVGKTGSQ